MATSYLHGLPHKRGALLFRSFSDVPLLACHMLAELSNTILLCRMN
jgi:hypothetical protein